MNSQEPAITRSNLHQALRSAASHLTGLEKIKTIYRPFICPIHEALALLPEQQKLYDIGCGNGSFLYLCQQFRQATAIAGHDASPRVTVAHTLLNKAQADNIRFISKAERMPDLSAYDYVYVIDVLHHIPNKDKNNCLKSIVDSMSLCAKLVILDINGNHLLGRLINQLHDLILVQEWVQPSKPSTIINNLQQQGMQLESYKRFRSLWYFHYLLVFSKNAT